DRRRPVSYDSAIDEVDMTTINAVSGLRYFFFNDTATTEIYPLSLPTLFRSRRITGESHRRQVADPSSTQTAPRPHQTRHVLLGECNPAIRQSSDTFLFTLLCV